MPTLTPADLFRCQAEITTTPGIADAFLIGGSLNVRTERCDNKPVMLVTERTPGADGLIGSMTLCPSCLAKFLDTAPQNVQFGAIVKA